MKSLTFWLIKGQLRFLPLKICLLYNTYIDHNAMGIDLSAKLVRVFVLPAV